MDDVVLSLVAARAGLVLIFWRRTLAPVIVRQQNRFWRTTYGAGEVAFNERALIVIGLFSLALALSFWLHLVWLPIVVLVGGIVVLNISRLRRRG
jgi:hypothetical protein